MTLIQNGGFEIAGDGTTWANWEETWNEGFFADDTIVFHSGEHSARIDMFSPGNSPVLYQPNIAVTGGSTYQLQFWYNGQGLIGSNMIF